MDGLRGRVGFGFMIDDFCSTFRFKHLVNTPNAVLQQEIQALLPFVTYPLRHATLDLSVCSR